MKEPYTLQTTQNLGAIIDDGQIAANERRLEPCESHTVHSTAWGYAAAHTNLEITSVPNARAWRQNTKPAVSQTPAGQRLPLQMWARLPRGPPGRRQLARCEGRLPCLLPAQVLSPCTGGANLSLSKHRTHHTGADWSARHSLRCTQVMGRHTFPALCQSHASCISVPHMRSIFGLGHAGNYWLGSAMAQQ